jgi:hypothetical protein
MALKKKGDLTFKLQPGAKGPYPDSTYELYRREEEWVGQETDLTSFLASKPKDSAHPSYGYLKLYEYSVTLNEAGMASVNLVYTGHPNGVGSTSPTKRFQKMLKTQTVTGRLRRRFWRWVYEDVVGVNPFKMQIEVNQIATADINYRYYSPTVTYRYSSATLVTSPKYASLAASDLAGQTPSLIFESSKKTSTYTHDFVGAIPVPWITNGDDLSGYDINGYVGQTITVTTESQDGQPIESNPIIRAADLVCEQRGSFYEVEETHEIELQ